MPMFSKLKASASEVYYAFFAGPAAYRKILGSPFEISKAGSKGELNRLKLGYGTYGIGLIAKGRLPNPLPADLGSWSISWHLETIGGKVLQAASCNRIEMPWWDQHNSGIELGRFKVSEETAFREIGRARISVIEVSKEFVELVGDECIPYCGRVSTK